MLYGYARNTGHGSRPTAYRYRPTACGTRPTAYGSRTTAYSRSRLTAGRCRPTARSSYGTDGYGDWFTGGRSDLGLTLIGFAAVAAVVSAGPLLVGWGLYHLVRWFAQASRTDESAALRHHLYMQRRLRRSNRTGRHPPPSAERLLEQWAASRNSLEDKMILGAMLGDLEAAVDNSYIRDEHGEIIGRKAGIRGWIADNCPALFTHYKTLMRYKAIADKMRVFAEGGGGEAGASTPTSSAASDSGTALPEALLGPAATRGPAAADAAARVRALLERCRTLAALDDALWAALGLVRTRRQPKRRAA